MSFLKPLSVIAISTILAACMANPNIMDLSDEERHKIASIKLYKDQAPPSERTYSVIEQIQGLSCWRNTQNPKIVTEEEALDGLLIRAAKLGGDGVINISCVHKDKVDWSNNCWESISCQGDAVIFTNQDSEQHEDSISEKQDNYTEILLEELSYQNTGLEITSGNNYPKSVYNTIGVVKIVDCQNKDYLNLLTIIPLPERVLFVPLPPPDTDDLRGLQSHERIKKKSAIESIEASAKKANADAIVNLICQPSTGPTNKYGCKSYVQCVGDMISLKEGLGHK